MPHLREWAPVLPALFREPIREVLVIVIRRGWYVSPIEEAMEAERMREIDDEEELWDFIRQYAHERDAQG